MSVNGVRVVSCLLLGGLVVAGPARAQRVAPSPSAVPPPAPGTAAEPATVPRPGQVSRERRIHTARGALTRVEGAHEAYVGRAALVRLEPGAALSALPDLDEAVLLSPTLRIYQVSSARAEDGRALARRLADLRGVRDAAPDLYYPRARADIDVPPNDPRYGGQWYLERIGIEQAWAIEDGTPETSVVIVDNGCEMTHPDLAQAFVGGRDVRDEDDDPSPVPEAGDEHGTACAGIVAGVGDNGEGIAGVCPECTLYCVRLLGPRGSLTSIGADIAAFEYARSVGAAVVSNSWGFRDDIDVPPMLGAVIESLFDDGRDGLGTLVVFSAGNDNRALRDEELTGVRGVLNVGAINLFDESTPFTNFGPSVDLAAPTGTLTTDLTGAAGENPTDYTDLFGGTSSSCPVVAGVAGLVFSARPDLSAREVHDLLIETARPAPFAVPDENGHDPIYGFGIVDPAAALRQVAPPAPDAGLTDGGVGVMDGDDGGCGCRAAGGRGAAPWALTLLLAVLLRRRRARR